MFKYTLFEKFRQKGLSPAAISPEMRNRFDAHFGTKEGISPLNNRLQVRLDTKAIRFFFYTGKDIAEETVLLEEKYKEIVSISLTHVKETGSDILNFDKTTGKKYPKTFFDKQDKDKKVIKQIVKFTNNLAWTDEKKPQFPGFPFIDNRTLFYENKIVNDKDKKELFAFFMQCCFLHFILEMENRKFDFAQSPLYDEVRNKLRESFVYQLLCAKLKYTVRLYGEAGRFSEDDYGFLTQKFADHLMDKDLNKVIPSDYYNEKLWFYNPETELDFIVKRNAKNCKIKGGAKLSDKLLDKIRNFFFTKHAVVSAMEKPWMKKVYWIYIFMIGTFSAYATWCLLYFDSDSLYFDSDSKIKIVDLFFKKIVVWDWVAVISVVLLVVLWMCTKSVSVFMPRALVAIGIGWLTTFISEDIIKSQVTIGIRLTVAAFIGVILLISILLLGEIRQHSPYYWGNLFNRKRAKQSSSWKLAPILIHSYFWALSLGVIMQLALYKNLLEHSRALPEIVFEQTFDKADNYVLYLNNLRDVLVSYEDDWMVLCNGSSRSSGTSRDKDKFSSIKMYPDPDFAMYAERFQLKANNIIGKYDTVRNYREKICKDWEQFCVNIRSKGSDELGYGNTNSFPQFSLDSLVKPIQKLTNMKDSLSSKDKYDIITHQLLFLDSIIFQTEEEIRNNRLFVTNNDNWDSLIIWSEYEHVNCEISPKDIQDCLKMTAIYEKNLCRKVNDLWWIKEKDKNKYLFPRMLIFHSLIVLLIAFVGQLIISDKSVTEPL